MSSPSPKLVLYDLSSIFNPKCWSPNTGEIRFLLNVLQVQYDVRFLKYQDIAPTLKSVGVKSWSEQGIETYAEYTLPALTFVGPEEGTEETVMGGEFNIVDKLIEELGPEAHQKIYQDEEEFIKFFLEFKWQMVMTALPIAAPFIYNALEDDESKNFYRDTRIEQGLGDILELQEVSPEKITQTWETIKREFLGFKSFPDFAKNKGLSNLQIDQFEKKLTSFQNGETKYIAGDYPTLADCAVYAALNWFRTSMQCGCTTYDLLDDKHLKDWFDRMSSYNV